MLHLKQSGLTYLSCFKATGVLLEPIKHGGGNAEKMLEKKKQNRIKCLYSAFSERAMAPHSSTLASKVPWMEEPGRLQSMGARRVGHD